MAPYPYHGHVAAEEIFNPNLYYEGEIHFNKWENITLFFCLCLACMILCSHYTCTIMKKVRCVL
jgi:hypothetical protein